ncbi:predicted protein [Chaetomium globosum CBS 148.51]|uniref:Uncharacterized protein n=1 Tax=Chaetomium globosum (strain ATCC 6205 / CBS 148.51 / DSM 1962 / NBRC 6347 / NRRL 1970) TaxID=306901 RepID=Q2GSD1_CHAGB|nr:uncharacterized protein CHGG_09123 [Chaetomium globosum CBS 148.51]EAQ85109.1 predicted protein [Chaetomium globosum CBS 148.51]
MARRPGDSAKWMSLTQIRFMIQAYERLRDQISEGNQCDPSQATALQDMFDMWLRALAGWKGLWFCQPRTIE